MGQLCWSKQLGLHHQAPQRAYDIYCRRLSVAWISTYPDVRHIHTIYIAAKLSIKGNASLPFSKWLSRKGWTRRNLGISHVRCSFLFTCEANEIELIVRALEYFIKDPFKCTLYYVHAIYYSARPGLFELRQLYTEFAAMLQLSSFQVF